MVKNRRVVLLVLVVGVGVSAKCRHQLRCLRFFLWKKGSLVLLCIAQQYCVTLKIFVGRKSLHFFIAHYAGFLVIAHTFFEEVGFALQ